MNKKITVSGRYPENNPYNDGWVYTVLADGVEVAAYSSKEGANKEAARLKRGEYAQVLGADYDRMSKEELAAVAVSFSLLLNCEDFGKVPGHIKEELKKVRAAGVV